MRKNQTTRTTLAPSSPSSPSSPLSLSSSTSTSTSPQKSPTSSPRKSKPMLGLGFGGVPYRASIPICELKVPNEREKRDVGGSVMGGAAAAGVENDKTTVSLNSSSSSSNNKTNQQEPDTPSTNSPQTPTDISEPFSYHRDLGSGKIRTRTEVAAFDSAATMGNLNLKNNNNNTDESEENDHNDNDHNNTNNNTKNNNNDHHHDNNNNPSLFNPSQIPKPTFQDLEEPYGGTKHFMMAHGLKCKFTPILHILTHSYTYIYMLIRFWGWGRNRVRFHRLCNSRENFGPVEGYGVAESGE